MRNHSPPTVVRGPIDPGRPRGGFTLVEVLTVLVVLTMLASMVMLAVAGAQEEARRIRTVSQITRLNDLIMDRWEGYKTRRVPIHFTNQDRATRQTRTFTGRCELMRTELPCQFPDIDTNPTVIAMSSLQQYYRNYVSTNYRGSTKELYGSAECLYMIVSSMSDTGGQALDFFPDAEIGDKDQDGLKEFWDGWQMPIEFIRWAPAYAGVSNFQDVDEIARLTNTDPEAALFSVYPLIVSAGPDKQYNLRMPESVSGGNLNDPFTSQAGALERPDSGEELDNITNHALTAGG